MCTPLILVWGALAAEPPAFTPSHGADGSWNVDFVVPARVEQVRSILADPIRLAGLSPDIQSAVYLSRGACDAIRVQSAPSAMSVAYDMRRCPTADGFSETLLASSTFDAYEVSWKFSPEGDSTRVHYRILIDMAIPVPRFFVDSHTLDSVKTLLGRVYKLATGG